MIDKNDKTLQNKKVLITGATGLIGKEAIKHLFDKGLEVYATVRGKNGPDKRVKYIKCDLFDTKALENVFNEIRPYYLLNFAWATSGDYLSSEVNFDYLKAGLNLLEYFNKNGGKRAVFAGTCFEYDFKNDPINEKDKIGPKSVYAICKNELREKAEVFCKKNNLSFGWGRIFYVFGSGENPKRLTPFVINSLKNNKEVTIRSSGLIKDYMYSKEIARAFVEFLASEIRGEVNICSAQSITLGEFCKKIAQKLKKEEFLNLEYNQSEEPPFIVGCNKRLTEEIGFKPMYNLDQALDEILQNEE